CFGGGVDGNGNGIQCLICTASFYLPLGSTRCLSSCPDGQVTGIDNNCLACAYSCNTCITSTTNCVTCSTGFIFVSGTSGPCISSCPPAKYSTGSACTS